MDQASNQKIEMSQKKIGEYQIQIDPILDSLWEKITHLGYLDEKLKKIVIEIWNARQTEIDQLKADLDRVFGYLSRFTDHLKKYERETIALIKKSNTQIESSEAKEYAGPSEQVFKDREALAEESGTVRYENCDFCYGNGKLPLMSSPPMKDQLERIIKPFTFDCRKCKGTGKIVVK